MAETTTNDRYMEGEGVGFDYAPSFTKGYPLPDGWQWVCFDDGSRVASMLLTAPLTLAMT